MKLSGYALAAAALCGTAAAFSAQQSRIQKASALSMIGGGFPGSSGGGGMGGGMMGGGGMGGGMGGMGGNTATAPAPGGGMGGGMGTQTSSPSGNVGFAQQGGSLARPQSPIEKAQINAPSNPLSSPGKTAVGDGSVPSILLQGGSLKTWSFASAYVERLQVALTTAGRPLDADIELWQGPDNCPVKMRTYVEDGSIRPFTALIETPRGPSTCAIRNIGEMEFPFAATVTASEIIALPHDLAYESLMTVQGGALRTYPFDPTVDSIQVLLKTDGRPLNARIELLQGPNNNKQVIELYTEDGLDRPFFCVLGSPGAGNVVRVVNTAPIEFPLQAAIVPNRIMDPYEQDLNAGVVIGGDTGW